MSLKRLAVISAIGSANHHHSNHSSNWTFHPNNDTNYLSHLDQQQNNKNYNQGLRVMRPGGTSFHGNVNILLGGAMLSVVTTIVCLICYCCHRKIKMRSTSSLYRQQRWFESDPNMEQHIYSVEQYFDTSGLFTDVEQIQTNNNRNEPPPSYEDVISRKRKDLLTFREVRQLNEREKEDNDEAIMSTTSNASSAYDLNQQNVNQSALCNCNSTITHHFVSNLCENCNNLIISTGNTMYNTSNTCYGNQYNYCADELNNNIQNNNQQQHECCLESYRETPTTTPTENQPQNDLNNNENSDNIQMENDENGNETSSINLNCIGLVRLDMSQIMDHTGLPTYDAAIKLESSGYV